jgi:hypothetical protein
MFNFNRKYFDNLKYTPRQPTPTEVIALTTYCLTKQYGFGKNKYTEQDCRQMEARVSRAALAVFDNFEGRRYLVVIWEDDHQSQRLKWYENHWQEVSTNGSITDTYRP